MLGFGLSIEPQIWAVVFVMIRIGAAFITAPVFGAVSIPLTVRVSISGAIAFLVLQAHPIVPPAQIFGLATVLSVAAEALVRRLVSAIKASSPRIAPGPAVLMTTWLLSASR